MLPKIRISLILPALLFAVASPAMAQEISEQTDSLPVADFANLLPAALILLLPIGFILLTVSALPEAHAPSVTAQMVMIWGLAMLAYFAVGFAFQFGGIAQVTNQPGLSGLYWEWYPLGQSVDLSVARLWGVVALQGWALTGAAQTPDALALFANHIGLVGLTALLSTAVLLQQKRLGLAVLVGLLAGAILYPLAGNWVWGSGWLSQLGLSLGLGHGFVDFGGAGVIFLTGSMAALISLLIFKPTVDEDESTEPEEVVVPVTTAGGLTVYEEKQDDPVQEFLPVVPMPSAYLPILGVMGASFMLVSWVGLAMGQHAPTAVNFSPSQAAVGGLLAAFSAALGAASYSWFTTKKINPLITTQGMAAGLVLAAAGAPFIPPWILVVAGLIMGLLLPLLLYLFNQVIRLNDTLGIVVTYGISAIVGLALVGFFANGQVGQGWNGVALRQGVSGLVVTSGYIPHWPDQFQAQMLGLGALAILSLGITFLVLQTVKVIRNAWTRSGLEISKPAKEDGGQPFNAP